MHTKVVALFVFVAAGFVGCTSRTPSESVMGMEVTLPLDEMMLYPADKRDTLPDYRYRYVVYVDSLECSPCKIIHMGIWNHFCSELADARTAFCMIFSPPKGKVAEMKRVYDTYRHRIPIYIDTLGVFERDNPQFAQLPSTFHSFLLDTEGKMVVIGDASTNHYARDEVFDVISKGVSSTGDVRDDDEK